MVRSFEDRPLPRDVVERILSNAMRAPSAGFTQGWAFLAFEGADQTQQYWDAAGPDDAEAFRWQDLHRAPLLIVCLSNKKAYLDRYAEADKGWTDRSKAHWPAPYWDIDTGMAALLILQTATDAGLGACFFGLPKDRIPIYRKAFGVPDAFHPIGAISIGYPGNAPKRDLRSRRKPADHVIHRGRW
jgi:nitroreductase